MSERDPFAPVIEGFDCSGITDPYSYSCEPFFVDGENAGTLLDGSTVHDALASKIRLSWNLTVLTPERYAALIAALEGAESLDAVTALVYDATVDALRLARFHATRPSCRAISSLGETRIIPQSALVLEEASPIARFVITPPRKLSYSVGDTLDLSGLSVIAYDKDGEASDVTAECAVSPADGDVLTESGAVAVSYGGFPIYAAALGVAEGTVIDSGDGWELYDNGFLRTDAAVVGSGDWWTLYDNGWLYIYSDGATPSFASRYQVPWYRANGSRYLGPINRVTFKNSVTSIGNRICMCLNHAYQSGNLISVTIPDSVTRIGKYAFDSASITSVAIPASVTSIGHHAFFDCEEIESFDVAQDNPNYSSADGVLFNKDGSELLQYPAKKSGAYAVPSGVTSIKAYAFNNCDALTSVTIPDSVKEIGAGAFALCSNLASVKIPSSVKVIDSHTFEGCNALTSVTIPDGVISIAQEAFNGCHSLAAITIPGSVGGIGKWAFQGCRALTSVTIGDGMTSIGYGAFDLCPALSNVTIPESVKSIGQEAFNRCPALSNVTIPESVKSIGEKAFQDCSALASVTISRDATVGADAFPADCAVSYYDFAPEDWWTLYGNGLLDIHCVGNMPDYYYSGTTKRPAPWYNYCAQISSVTIGDGVTSIGEWAFYECRALASVTIPGSVKSIGYYAFHECRALTSVTIGDGVTSIGSGAFRTCLALTSVTIPDSVTSIEELAFASCSALASVTIPDGVRSIRREVFNNCSSLTSVTIPDGVTSIGVYAFNNCSKLTDVYYKGNEEQRKAISIGNYNDPLTSATWHYNYGSSV